METPGHSDTITAARQVFSCFSGPAHKGEATRFHLSDSMTVEQLRDQAVDETRRSPGFKCVRANNAKLIFEGKPMKNPDRVSSFGIPASSVIHLTLMVHGG